MLTSARRYGRVEVGSSWQLGEWLNMSRQQREPYVDNPVPLAALWWVRPLLRAHWAVRPVHPCRILAGCLGLPPVALLARVQLATTFGSLWEWVLKNSPAATVASLPLSRALLVLSMLIRQCRVRPVVFLDKMLVGWVM